MEWFMVIILFVMLYLFSASCGMNAGMRNEQNEPWSALAYLAAGLFSNFVQVAAIVMILSSAIGGHS